MQKTSELYKNLYHYTNWDGLTGILQSNSLWATHFKFLNDNTELELFRKERLPKILYPLILECFSVFLNNNQEAKAKFEHDGYNINDVSRYEAQNLINSMYDSLQGQIYLSSFCGEAEDPYISENGLLSQWRAYGENGGFAIVFDTKLLEERLLTECAQFAYGAGSLSSVVYSHDDDSFKREFTECISKIQKFANFLLSKILNISIDDVEPPYSEFLNCITRYKHRAFEEENEVRIVLDFLADSLLTKDGRKCKKVEYRGTGNSSVPYIKLFEGNGTVLPISKIIVGPQVDQEHKKALLQTMLVRTDIKVTSSDIPYIG